MTKYRLVCRTMLLMAAVVGTENRNAMAAPPAPYRITDLGTLGGTASGGGDINASGQVTGVSRTTGDAGAHAFLWTPTTPNGATGTMTDLGTPSANYNSSSGEHINDSGRVIVFLPAGDAVALSQSFLWTPTTPNGSSGAMQDLGALGGSVSHAAGINDHGHVTGTFYSPEVGSHAFLYDGTLHDLGTLGGVYSHGLAINDIGQVTGSSKPTANATEHHFLWTPTTPNGTSGTMIDLGSFGGTLSGGLAINDRGQVVGYSYLPGDIYFHAFLWTPTTPNGASGTMIDLGSLGGTFSAADGINNFGQVVGVTRTTGDGPEHAFLYTSGGGMVDLNSLIDQLSGWELSFASAINDAGQITGGGQFAGEARAFLLSPVPEPASCALLCLGMLLLSLRKSRHRRSLAQAMLALCATMPTTHADIYQWEYVNPASTSEGKRESANLTPDGAGANAVSGAMLFGRNLTKAYLIGAELGGYWVEGGEFSPGYYVLSNLSGANLTEADLTNANISLSDLYGTNFTNAEVRGAQFGPGYAFTATQLASTASYKTHDLTGIGLSYYNLSGWNLAGQNLVDANFRYATLTGVNFANAVVRGAAFGRNGFLGEGTGITAAQLATTASYQAHDLVGINLNENNLSGANLADQNLTDADFYGANVNNANLSRANLSHASFTDAGLTGANLNQANLAGAIFNGATMTGATMVGADVRGAAFSVISTAQLYSTASYQAHDLTGIVLSGNSLSGANFGGQNLMYAGLSGTTLTNANFSQANLTNAGFHQANLAGANFTGATIRGANFTDYGAGGISKSQLYSTASYEAHDLSGIVLDGNSLKGVEFAGQNLTEANLSTTTLTNGNFSQASLEDADFTGASVNNANLSQANLTNANFTFAYLTGANLTGAEVRGANFYFQSDPLGNYGSGLTVAQLHSTASYAAHDLRGIVLANNNLAGANLTGQNLANAQFATSFDTDGADLTSAKFVQANLTNANFYYATLHNADLRQANLTNSNIHHADLSGANLTGAEVRGTDFSYNGNPEALSLAQLYSTASYQSHDLSGINLGDSVLPERIWLGRTY